MTNPLADVPPQSLVWIDREGNYSVLTEGDLFAANWRDVAVLQFALRDTLAWVEHIAQDYAMPERLRRMVGHLPEVPVMHVDPQEGETVPEAVDRVLAEIGEKKRER